MISNERRLPPSGIIAFLLIAGIFSSASGQTTSDSLDVRVTNIAIAAEISARGLTAAFPHPVLATITVADSSGNPVFGLADTSRWLTPQDVANNGLPITRIWKRAVEYHRDNRSYPPNPNIFEQVPAPFFTEFRQSTPFPTSTMLVMDVSGSMIEELPAARNAARFFVDLLRPVDRAGVIQFSHSVKAFQPMTNDKQKLFAIIDSAKADGTTGLYDALVYAVQATKLENSRRAIIVYTDGVDITSTFTPAAVIDSASFYSIPIFTIALGASSNPDTLRRIARETGGLFFQANHAVEFDKIYQRIATLIQNFYMIAYSSPDTARNGTWRTLEVTVDDQQQRRGRNGGDYFVPGGTTLRPTDLAVSLTSLSDLTANDNGHVIQAVRPGDRYTYRLRVENLGNERAEDIHLNQILPPSVSFLSATNPPSNMTPDSLTWQIASFAAGVTDSIVVTAQLAADVPPAVTQLISRLTLSARNDDNPANNTALDTAQVVFSPATYTDLAVSQFVETDSFAVVGNDTMHFAKSGETIFYRIVVRNIGTVAAQNIRLVDFLPDSVRAQNILPAPASAEVDSIVWTLPSLLSQTSASFTFSATVSSNMPAGTNILINKAIGGAKNEDPTKAADNTSIDTVYNVVKPPPPPPTFADLEVSQFVETDSFAVVGNDTMHFAKSGETIFYRIVAKNIGTVVAQNIRVADFLPDSVRAQNFLPAPASAYGDSVIWTLPSLLSQTSASFTFSATVSSDMPVGTNLLINKVVGRANNEDPTRLGDNTSIDTVYSVVEPPPPLTDFSFDLNSHTLSSVVENGRAVNTARPGEPIDYKIFVHNLGPNSSDNIRVRQLLPDSVRFVGASQALSFASKDSVIWQIAQLNSGGADSITISVLFASEVPQSLTQLISRAELFAANDNTPANNSAADTIRVIVPSPLGPTDLAVALDSRTDLTFLENGRLVNATTPGRLYEYHLQVRNLGVERAENIRLRQSLPDSVRFISSSLAPALANRDSLVWQLAALNAGGVDSIKVTVHLAPMVPRNLERLISRLTLFAANDHSPANNTAIDTVRVLFPPPSGTAPLIEANPPEVTVGDSVRVRVQVLGDIKTWDLWVYFANGQIDSSFADAFIRATPLSPTVWQDVTPAFTNTRLFTSAKEEQIRFEIRTRDVLNILAAASDAVVVRSNNDLVLDRNVFEAGTQTPLGINFKLSSNRLARLDVYDLNGVCITKLVEAPFNAGWNTYNWNGLTETGRQVGSGVYIVALRSGEFTAWKKCIIVR